MTTNSPTKPRRNALVGQVIHLLQDAISTGQWPVGTRIPVEAELAVEYGVSRITLRQAVQALVHVGQLETIQGNGTFVRAATEVEAVLARYLSDEALRSVLEVRQAIETQAAGLAAERARTDDISRLHQILGEGQSAAEANDLNAAALASARFHQAIVQASGNEPLLHMYTALDHSVSQSIEQATPPQQLSAFVREHRQILRAIETGNAERARKLSQQHLSAVLDQTT